MSEEAQPTAYTIVKAWPFDDWGLYGRGDELLTRALARHPRVARVIHLQVPVDPADLRERFRSPRWEDDMASQLRRLDGLSDDGIWLFTPSARGGAGDEALDQVVAMLEREQAFAQPLVLLQELGQPFFAELARRLGGRGVVRVAAARRDLRAAETDASERAAIDETYRSQVAAADLAWAGTPELLEEFKTINPVTGPYPVGADLDLVNGRAAHELAGLPRPIVVYAGSMRAYLDVPLLRGAAERLPDHSFVFVGPAADFLLPLVDGLRNVHVIGPRPYALLAGYLAAADVAIAPHLVVPATRAVVPEKLFGYLAAGLPVVCTPVAGVDDLRRLVWVTRNASEMARAIQGAIKRDRERRRALRVAAITPLSWGAVATHVVASVDAVRAGQELPAPPQPHIPAIPGFLAR